MNRTNRTRAYAVRLGAGISQLNDWAPGFPAYKKCSANDLSIDLLIINSHGQYMYTLSMIKKHLCLPFDFIYAEDADGRPAVLHHAGPHLQPAPALLHQSRPWPVPENIKNIIIFITNKNFGWTISTLNSNDCLLDIYFRQKPLFTSVQNKCFIIHIFILKNKHFFFYIKSVFTEYLKRLRISSGTVQHD